MRFVEFSCLPCISSLWHPEPANDKEQVVPMLELVEAQSAVVGVPTRLLANTGYCSKKNTVACADANVAPLSAGAGIVQTMAHTLKPRPGVRSTHCSSKPLNRSLASSNR